MTPEAVEKALDEVRPYLIADGGNVEVPPPASASSGRMSAARMLDWVLRRVEPEHPFLGAQTFRHLITSDRMLEPHAWCPSQL
jgi:hypothetical protein